MFFIVWAKFDTIISFYLQTILLSYKTVTFFVTFIVTFGILSFINTTKEW